MEQITSHPLYKKMDSFEVISETFRGYFKHFVPLISASILANLVIHLVVFALGLQKGFMVHPSHYPVVNNLGDLVLGSFIILFVALFVYSFVFSFMANYIFQVPRPSQLSAKAILRDTLYKHFGRVLVVMVLVSIITSLAFVFGVIVLIIGSLVAFLYFGTVFSSFGGIIVAEQRSSLDVMGRCFNLSHKDFWEALGAFVLFLLSLLVISVILGILSLLPQMFYFIGEALSGKGVFDIMEGMTLMQTGGYWVTALLNFVFSSLIMPLLPVFSVVLYLKVKYKEDHALPPLPYEKREN